MENNRIDNLSDVSAVLENILQRINALEKEIALLKGETVPEGQAFDESEAIDLSLDDMSFEEPAAVYPEKDAEPDMPEEDIPVLDSTEDDLPVSFIEENQEEENQVEESIADTISEPEPDDFSNLFGSEFEDIPQEKPKRGRKPSSASILNEASADSGKAVVDVMAEKSAWLHDMPGSEVKSLRSAIALGDQVLFIRRLFREDSALYQDTIDKLNSMTTLREAVRYIGETFPEWDSESDDVYRFMMAVRRKIRK